MHDQTYFKELAISNKENGYRDLIAVPDLSSFRRIPWEDNVPFFLISFLDPDTKATLSACPRSLLKRAVGKLKENGYGAMAGGESPPHCCAGGQVLHVSCEADYCATSRVRVLPIPRTANTRWDAEKHLEYGSISPREPGQLATKSYGRHVRI
jgi:hypothetical protein